MITTVSVSTVSSITSMAALGFTGALSMACAVMLIVLLMTRQLALASGSGFYSRLGRFAAVAAVPLLVGVGCIMLIQLLQLIS